MLDCERNRVSDHNHDDCVQCLQKLVRELGCEIKRLREELLAAVTHEEPSESLTTPVLVVTPAHKGNGV